MKKRLLVGGLVGGVLAVLFPFAAQAGTHTAAAPATCIVVSGPSGLNLQVGYAPNGPADCQHI
ncbi:MAG: hypothetical protein JOZ37_05530 [Actinobacteria bacterium]|nr:hypothetical protein [Actinomycetota bacterium]MBV8959079.1 hypothetical protein [Actinomycetota bacterium]MBV9255012.1 hypothetical protein [Actinomycetota bacterium]MBV9663407.1 hypothetical protein [Actinomycetota bacterium]MBV9934073.1 hypothetical protein [Actinomycetota bacterium]